MKRYIFFGSIIFFAFSFWSLVFAPEGVDSVYAESNKWTALVSESGMVLDEIQRMPDQSIPEDLLRQSFGIAIFPNTVSAGLGIGGKYGQGIVMVRDEKTGVWSPPAIFDLTGVSFGFQIGGQATDFVLLINSRRGIDGLLASKFKLGADAAVAAGPVGRNAEASTDAQLKGNILAYSRSRGLFAGVKLEGALMNFNEAGTQEVYGKAVSAREVLIDSTVKMPAAAKGILSTLRRYPFKR